MRIVVATTALILLVFLRVDSVAQCAEQTGRSDTRSFIGLPPGTIRKPCDLELSEKIAKFYMGKEYSCFRLGDPNSGDKGATTNINSPKKLVEDVAEGSDGLTVNISLALFGEGWFSGPDYALVFSYFSTYCSEKEIIRHFDRSHDQLILIADNEPMYVEGYPLGWETHKPGDIAIEENRYFTLTMQQLVRLAAANKVTIKLGNISGALSEKTLQMIKDTSGLIQ